MAAKLMMAHTPGQLTIGVIALVFYKFHKDFLPFTEEVQEFKYLFNFTFWLQYLKYFS